MLFPQASVAAFVVIAAAVDLCLESHASQDPEIFLQPMHSFQITNLQS